MVDIHDVDRLDGGVGVRVSGEQRTTGPREQVHRALQELDTVHPRHPVVREDRGHRLAAQLQLLERVERLTTGTGPQDPVLLAVAATQVTRHRPGNARVVIDGEQDRFDHRSILLTDPRGRQSRTISPQQVLVAVIDPLQGVALEMIAS